MSSRPAELAGDRLQNCGSCSVAGSHRAARRAVLLAMPAARERFRSSSMKAGHVVVVRRRQLHANANQIITINSAAIVDFLIFPSYFFLLSRARPLLRTRTRISNNRKASRFRPKARRKYMDQGAKLDQLLVCVSSSSGPTHQPGCYLIFAEPP